jgi:hypothetical protein
MGNNNAEVLFHIRLPVDRRMAVNRRLFFKQEYHDHNLERRVNIINRRMLGDRRELLPEIMNTFWKEVL